MPNGFKGKPSLDKSHHLLTREVVSLQPYESKWNSLYTSSQGLLSDVFPFIQDTKWT
jgi:hypothetical protein